MTRKEFRTPKTAKAFCKRFGNGDFAVHSIWKEQIGPRFVDVRIVRESDYQRLIRAAKRDHARRQR